MDMTYVDSIVRHRKPGERPRLALEALRSAVAVAIVLALLAGCGVDARRSEREDVRGDGMLHAADKIRTGQFDEALQTYRRVVRRDPDNALAHFELGILLQDHQKDAAASLFHFQNYLDLRPDSDKAPLAQERLERARKRLGTDGHRGAPDEGANRGISDLQIVARIEALNAQVAERDRTIHDLREEIAALQFDNDRLGKEVASLDNRLRLLLDDAGAVSRPPSPALRDRTLDGTETAAVERPPADARPAERRPPPGARTYRVQRGDSLWSIAQKVYGDANRNVDIRNANPGLIGPNDRLREGVVLILP